MTGLSDWDGAGFNKSITILFTMVITSCFAVGSGVGGCS